MQMFLIAIAMILSVLGSKFDPVSYQAYLEAEPHLFHLTSANFESLTAHGTWAIFYGSKECPHCHK